jgi:hypothetical protein
MASFMLQLLAVDLVLLQLALKPQKKEPGSQ